MLPYGHGDRVRWILWHRIRDRTMYAGLGAKPNTILAVDLGVLALAHTFVRKETAKAVG